MPFGSLIRRIRPLPAAEAEALVTYRDAVAPLVERVVGIRDEWLEAAGGQPVDEQIANTASVRRWELARLASQLAEVAPTVVAASAHQQLRQAVEDAARGCQLLATGARSHKSEAICDGQVLLVKAAESVERVLLEIDARLGRS